MKCINADRCRSPVACSGFGYCRERNFDGAPMTQDKINRLRQEEVDRQLACPSKSNT